MDGAQDQVTGGGRSEGDLVAFLIAHFTNDDHVGCLTKNIAQALTEGLGVATHLALVDVAHLVLM